MKQLILIASMISAGFAGHAGVSSSGGGNSVVCRDANKKIISAELLDFYEGRNLNGLNIVKSDAKVDDQIAMAVKNLSAGQDDEALLSLAQTVQNVLVMLPAGVGLQAVGDANTIVMPKGCEIEQVADFRDAESKVYIDSEIWNALGATDQAGLIFHETVYFYSRHAGTDLTSERARREVARSFSDAKISAVYDGAPVDAWECSSTIKSMDDYASLSRFKVYYDTASDDMILNFEYFEGHVMFEKATATFRFLDEYLPVKLPIDGGDSERTVWTSLQSPIDPGVSIELSFNKDAAGEQKMYIGQGEIMHPSKNKTEFTCKKGDSSKGHSLK